MQDDTSGIGSFLRSRREKVTPESAGIAQGRRRRTPGLRREEVAELAGISIDWYVRLEQGRNVKPSPATLRALARTLRLDPAEEAHLRTLARGGERAAYSLQLVPEAIAVLLASLAQPAYVLGLRWDFLARNAAAAEILADAGPDGAHNLLEYMLASPAARRLFGNSWEEEAQRMVAQFRPTFDLWAADPAFRVLHARLQADCPEFSGWWDAHDVRHAATGRKRLNHPSKGWQTYEYASFHASDDTGLRLVTFTPVDACTVGDGET